MSDFLAGSITMGYLVIGVFFLRFWRRTADTLFVIFAFAFWLLAANQAIVYLIGVPKEYLSWAYLLRAAAFTLISGDTYRATIPAIFVQTPAVEYYVSSTDNSPSANQALAPAGAPSTVSRFTVAVSDTAGPSLGHTPLTTAVPAGRSLGLDLTASDASGLGQVRIFWATAGSATYSATTASSLGGGNFYASIGPVRAPSVRY